MAKSVDGNRGAFLDMLAYSEGTTKVEGSDDGYNVIVGGALFSDYSDHPRTLVVLNKAGLKSTAAGRYQLLARYYDAYKEQLSLPDFSPASQDAIAIQQIRERKALLFVDNGNIELAIEKCATIWASLPGAGYGQRENSIGDLLAAYQQAGGTLA